ncbi:Murein DD-endopeptidase MepM and murein hydrolase activator NlpD, contain LysM domain [Lutibacter oricola]|uniref:Murein DD-endopeptidase MepM and murein hydrolase activator NlpD, contain LysM domain n=1 Tax=Lutibacter oricola TaxID=762486 RepID=A0A1H3G416_9FLAO|nr:M23 family metallopeptidase [Lutibacter oricola]SDX98072.1 Murein DD-endopeptidase MepM and murein hydrolase activator NlpD, contain LysM domain [Lutibacter oricola]
MAKTEKNKRQFKQKLINKYRLVVLNEDTFEEKLTFRLTRLNVFIFGSLFSIFLIVGTLFLIAFTPLKEYIPGYSSSALRTKATNLVYKADSLQQIIDVNDLYIKEVKGLLTGKVSEVQFDKDSVLAAIQYDKDSLELNPSSADLEFRLDVETADRYSIFSEATKSADVVFFAPVNGTITDGYDSQKKHYAVDLAVEMNTPVKSVADGTVIFAEWTAQTGHVIIVKHSGGYTSIYKHNTSLHKQQGDLVKSGEVIASAGDTGELSTGPHLHFELWNEGYPVNPTNYIDFE